MCVCIVANYDICICYNPVDRNPKKGGQTDNDEILDSLGIKNTASIKGSLLTLGKMIMGHTAIAIFGMFFNSKDL